MCDVGLDVVADLGCGSDALAVEQRFGITWDRVQEIAERVLHPQ